MDDCAALADSLFVLKNCIPWSMLPAELGRGSGVTCRRRLRDWQAAGVRARLHQALLERLTRAHRLNWRCAAADARSVAAIRPVKTGRRGGPRRRPAKLHADTRYDHALCRKACRTPGIKARVSRRGIEWDTRLGRRR